MTEAIQKCKITIKRYNPEREPAQFEQIFEVPYNEKSTVLQALIYIYENLDPSLTFSFSCRYEKCGLCGVEVNDRPSLACMTLLKKEFTVAPLSNLPVLKDLAIDRDSLEQFMQQEIIIHRFQAEGQEENEEKTFPQLNINPALSELLECRECLCCHARCSLLSGKAQKHFAGPYFFVKLAQLHLDPRDKANRHEQALKLGIQLCQDCRKCYCPQGIGIFKQAILPLLQI